VGGGSIHLLQGYLEVAAAAAVAVATSGYYAAQRRSAAIQFGDFHVPGELEG
jgi:hypothetical protein